MTKENTNENEKTWEIVRAFLEKLDSSVTPRDWQSAVFERKPNLTVINVPIAVPTKVAEIIDELALAHTGGATAIAVGFLFTGFLALGYHQAIKNKLFEKALEVTLCGPTR